MVYSIGLTGNIASGKSTAANIFSSLGIDVFSADKIARELSAHNPQVLNAISQHFGSEVLQADGQINRRRLRELIFSNPEQRIWLEQLLHPLIRKELELQVSLSQSPYCIVEIPLLKDKKSYPYLNKVLVITSSEEVQIERVMARDHCSREQALAILATQPNTSQRLQLADEVLINDAGFEELNTAIQKLHIQYLNES